MVPWRYALFGVSAMVPGFFFEKSRGGNGEKAGDQSQRRLGRSERAMEAAFGIRAEARLVLASLS